MSTLTRALTSLRPGVNFANLDNTLAVWEQAFVQAALELTQGNLARAAKLLGIHRTTLYSRMQNYQMGTAVSARSAPDK